MSNDYLTNAYLTDNSVISQIIGAYGNNFTIFLSYNLALRVNFEPLSKFLLTELIKFPYNFNSYISEDVMNNNPKISVANPGSIRRNAAKANAAPEIIS